MPIREDRKGQGNRYIVDPGPGVTQFSKRFPSPVSTPQFSGPCSLLFAWTSAEPGQESPLLLLITAPSWPKIKRMPRSTGLCDYGSQLGLLPAPPSHHITWYTRELRTLPSGPGLSLQTTIPFSDIPQEKWLYLPTYDAGKTFPLSVWPVCSVLLKQWRKRYSMECESSTFYDPRKMQPKAVFFIPLQPPMNSVSPASPKVSSFSRGSRCCQTPLPPARAWSLPPASVLRSSALSSDGIWLGSRIPDKSHRCPSNQALGQKRAHTFLPSCGAFLSGRSLESMWKLPDVGRRNTRSRSDCSHRKPPGGSRACYSPGASPSASWGAYPEFSTGLRG